MSLSVVSGSKKSRQRCVFEMSLKEDQTEQETNNTVQYILILQQNKYFKDIRIHEGRSYCISGKFWLILTTFKPPPVFRKWRLQ